MHFLCGYIHCKETSSFLVDATTLPICLFSAKIYDSVRMQLGCSLLLSSLNYLNFVLLLVIWTKIFILRNTTCQLHILSHFSFFLSFFSVGKYHEDKPYHVYDGNRLQIPIRRELVQKYGQTNSLCEQG